MGHPVKPGDDSSGRWRARIRGSIIFPDNSDQGKQLLTHLRELNPATLAGAGRSTTRCIGQAPQCNRWTDPAYLRLLLTGISHARNSRRYQIVGTLSRRLLAAATGNNATFAQRALAGQLARAADGFSFLARLFFRRLFEVTTQLHFTEDAFALHLLLQRAKRLIDIIVAYDYLNDNGSPRFTGPWVSGRGL